ncbi:hypothetical protein PXH69_24045 [Rhodococcus qingshengii]|uniref:Uncharacterized protein n=1 Tax=Rhodococcus qingshengii TaxID=334542 RepID=A0AAW6LNB3_RHOSG|nr:hypothetical protein [Rhodococcus qingshengii]MDE8648054.1 hypothetical protein [Rhodococcus qingshengii]
MKSIAALITSSGTDPIVSIERAANAAPFWNKLGGRWSVTLKNNETIAVAGRSIAVAAVPA